MTARKDYERAVRMIHERWSGDDRFPVAEFMRDFFEGDNPRFDRQSFMAAAMGETSIRGGKAKR